MQTTTSKANFDRYLSERHDFIQSVIDILQSTNLNCSADPFDVISKTSINIQSNNNLNIFPIDSAGRPNGNCFYESISKILFGDFQYFICIKFGLCFIYSKHRTFFEEVCEANGLKFDLKKSLRDNEWPDELDLLASSIVIDRPIYIFTVDPAFSYNISYSDEHRKKLPVCIAFDNILKNYKPLMRKSNSLDECHVKKPFLFLGISQSFKNFIP